MTDPRASIASDLWFPTMRPAAKAGLRLFSFPYAGATASSLAAWAQHLPPEIELRPLQLPAHGDRFAEPPIARLDRLVEAIGPAMHELIDRPFAIFGHCMGALLAFEVVRWLSDRTNAMPRHLYLSGQRAPHLPNDNLIPSRASDDEIVRRLRLVNGIPRRVLDEPALLALLLPSVRADLAVCETYQFEARPALTCPVTVVAGIDDEEAAPGRLESWQQHVRAPVTIHRVPGGHFYWQTSFDLLLSMLSQSLTAVLAADRAEPIPHEA